MKRRCEEPTMGISPAFSRRSVLRCGLSVAALTPLGGSAASSFAAAPGAAAGKPDPWHGLKIGIASYTFSRLPLETTIQGIRRVGVSFVSIKESHLPLKSTAEQRKQVVEKFRAAGITPLSCGVVNMTDDESAIRNA